MSNATFSTTLSPVRSVKLFHLDLVRWKKIHVNTRRLRASSQTSRNGAKITDTMGHQESSPKELYKLKGVSFGGAGIFFWWELGCVLWLLENVDVDSCPCFGASGGALAATLTACKVNPFRAFEVANRLATDHKVFERPLGLAGIWGGLIRLWLDELLPDNAAEICNSRVAVVVTSVPQLSLRAISHFESKECLIDANLASCHIPFFLDGKFSTNYKLVLNHLLSYKADAVSCAFRGTDCIDGSFQDFFSGSNSNLLTHNGRHLNFDYFHDKRLKSKRLDFVALKKPSDVMKMIYLGYEYTEGLSRTEAFKKAILSRTVPVYKKIQNSSISFNI